MFLGSASRFIMTRSAAGPRLETTSKSLQPGRLVNPCSSGILALKQKNRAGPSGLTRTAAQLELLYLRKWPSQEQLPAFPGRFWPKLRGQRRQRGESRRPRSMRELLQNRQRLVGVERRFARRNLATDALAPDPAVAPDQIMSGARPERAAPDPFFCIRALHQLE